MDSYRIKYQYSSIYYKFKKYLQSREKNLLFPLATETGCEFDMDDVNTTIIVMMICNLIRAIVFSYID